VNKASRPEKGTAKVTLLQIVAKVENFADQVPLTISDATVLAAPRGTGVPQEIGLPMSILHKAAQLQRR
jgi:hypothetical protein